MSKSRNFISLTITLFLISLLTPVFSSAEEKMDEEMMKKWAEYASPGENHKILNYFVGDWDYSFSWKMSPNAKPTKASGTSSGKWILDGRFVKLHAKGTYMGNPFEGFGHMGYDNASGKYTGLWIDNMSTGMMKSWGYYYPSSKKFVEWGKVIDPIFGKQAFRAVTTLINDNKYSYQFYMTDESGKEIQMMEIVYTRKK